MFSGGMRLCKDAGGSGCLLQRRRNRVNEHLYAGG